MNISKKILLSVTLALTIQTANLSSQDQPIDESSISTAQFAAIMSPLILAGSYLLDYYSPSSQEELKSQFPFATQWLKEMIAKYPAANLNLSMFMTPYKEHPPSDSDDEMKNKTQVEKERILKRWHKNQERMCGPQNVRGKIHYTHFMFTKINDIYEKIFTQQPITKDEETFLFKHEWLLLQTARPEQADSFAIKCLIVFLGSTAIEHLISSPDMKNAAGIGTLLSIIAYSRFDNIENELHANSLASSEALQGALSYLKDDESNIVTRFAQKYASLEQNAFNQDNSEQEDQAQSYIFQKIHDGVTLASKYGSQAFFTAMKPIKYICSQSLPYAGFDLLLNPTHLTKEQRIENITNKMNETA